MCKEREKKKSKTEKHKKRREKKDRENAHRDKPVPLGDVILRGLANEEPNEETEPPAEEPAEETTEQEKAAKKVLPKALARGPRRSLKRSIQRQLDRMVSKVADLHHKSINFLLRNYSLIVLPGGFGNQQMIGEISSRHVRRMMATLSHARLEKKKKKNEFSHGSQFFFLISFGFFFLQIPSTAYGKVA